MKSLRNHMSNFSSAQTNRPDPLFFALLSLPQSTPPSPTPLPLHSHPTPTPLSYSQTPSNPKLIHKPHIIPGPIRPK